MRSVQKKRAIVLVCAHFSARCSPIASRWAQEEKPWTKLVALFPKREAAWNAQAQSRQHG